MDHLKATEMWIRRKMGQIKVQLESVSRYRRKNTFNEPRVGDINEANRGHLIRHKTFIRNVFEG